VDLRLAFGMTPVLCDARASFVASLICSCGLWRVGIGDVPNPMAELFMLSSVTASPSPIVELASETRSTDGYGETRE
jgi:hypothetical protein